VGVQVKLRNPLRTRAIPERFCGGDSLRRGARYQLYGPLPLTLPLLKHPARSAKITITYVCYHRAFRLSETQSF